MARKYKKTNTGLRIFCVVLALIVAVGIILGGLQLWGKGKQKPSEWFKANLVPVTISFENDAPFGVAQTFTNGTRAYSLAAASASQYPSTKRATASCTLSGGESPERYEWEITGGTGLSLKTVNSDGSAADITAQTYFPGSATLTARAYLGDELRGIGSVGIRTKEEKEIDLYIYYYADIAPIPALTGQYSVPDALEITVNIYVEPMPQSIDFLFKTSEDDKIIFYDENGHLADMLVNDIENIPADIAFIDNSKNRNEKLDQDGYYDIFADYYFDQSNCSEILYSFLEYFIQSNYFDGIIEYIHAPEDASPIYNELFEIIDSDSDFKDYLGITLEAYDSDRTASANNFRCFLIQNIEDLELIDTDLKKSAFIVADYFQEIEQKEFTRKFIKVKYVYALKRTYNINALVQWAAEQPNDEFWQYMS